MQAACVLIVAQAVAVPPQAVAVQVQLALLHKVSAVKVLHACGVPLQPWLEI